MNAAKICAAVLAILVAVNLTGCLDLGKKSISEEPKSPVAACVANSVTDLSVFSQGEFQREKMIRQITHRLVSGWSEDFSFETRALERALREGGASSLTNARDAWKRSALSWAKLQAVEFGPSQENGALLSSQISSWPVTNLCLVDQMVAAYSENGSWPTQVANSAQGLQSLEYLLFAPNTRITCNRRAVPAVGAWLAKPAEERDRSRLQAASKIAETLAVSAGQLAARWNPRQGAYGELMLNSCVATDTRQAVNMVSDSLFYIEVVKDKKLALPLGLSTACGAESCPESAEAPFADFGLDIVRAHLEALQAVFHGEVLGGRPVESLIGQAPFGFDDYLSSLGRPDLALRIGQEIEASRAGAEALALKGGFAAQIGTMDETTRQEFIVFHDHVRALARSLKSDFLGVLDLRPPRLIEGDND